MSKCIWKYNSIDDYWQTGCDNAFSLDDGTPSENGMGFCLYCGKPLLQICHEHAVTPDPDDDAEICLLTSNSK
ncbi:MAG: hypothetical protein GY832_26000 [Chloroflexi bacterium]|nr:hypothetical protein [Chloroflexota bacterium]